MPPAPMSEPNDATVSEPLTVEAPAPDRAVDLAELALGEARVAGPLEVPVPPPAAPAGLRTARVSRIDRGRVFVVFRGASSEREADVDEAVDVELVRRAFESGDRVLCEADDDGEPVIVGVLQTRIPDKLELRARQIVIEGDEELVLRSGKAAMRLREDGDVELVGSRISTVSRGLFRLVGRMLRLN